MPVDFQTYMRRTAERTADQDEVGFIVDRAAARTVLDIGWVDHGVEHVLRLGDRWLHAAIARRRTRSWGSTAPQRQSRSWRSWATTSRWRTESDLDLAVPSTS
jgi:hypothetical protein